jgi:membrane protein implicated in regulation of membrane protease activity
MCHILFVLPLIGLILFWILPLQQAVLLYSLLLIVCSIFFWLMWKDFWRPVRTGVEGMVGSKAEVIRGRNGRSKVAFRGEIWDAVSHADLSAGQTVKITGVERMKLLVEAVKPAATVGENTK